MTLAQQFKSFIWEALNAAEKDIETIGIATEHSAALAVYLTILQQSFDCNLLLAYPSISAATVLRGILESYSDLRAILAAPTYIEKMTATALDQIRLLYENVLCQPGNPYHAGLASIANVPEELADVKMQLGSLERLGHKPLKTWQRFKEGGLSHEYQSIYWSLCMEGHNNIVSIQNRHVSQGLSGLIFDLRKVPTIEYLLVHYDPLAMIVVDSSLKIHELSKNSHVRAWTDRLQRLETLRVLLETAKVK